MNIQNNRKDKLPCLFDWADKELAQDSFLCWLLEWANSTPDNRSDFPERRVGFEFLKRILVKAKATIPSENDTVSVRVFKQIQHIDIAALIEFNDSRVGLLIEDKVNASLYNDIDSYCKNLNAQNDFSSATIYPVIVRTGDACQIGEVKVPCFLREDFLSLFNDCHNEVKKSQILLDFYTHLHNIDSALKMYETRPLAEWDWNCWKGFFEALRRSGKVVQNEWTIVNRPDGGFVCAYPSWQSKHAYFTGNLVMYWQFESDRQRLALKIIIDDIKVDQRRNRLVREYVLGQIDEYLNKTPDWKAIIKVARGRVGCSMTLKEIPADGWYRELDGKIDMNAVLERLEKINKFRDALVEMLLSDKNKERLLDISK